MTISARTSPPSSMSHWRRSGPRLSRPVMHLRLSSGIYRTHSEWFRSQKLSNGSWAFRWMVGTIRKHASHLVSLLRLFFSTCLVKLFIGSSNPSCFGLIFTTIWTTSSASSTYTPAILFNLREEYVRVRDDLGIPRND